VPTWEEQQEIERERALHPPSEEECESGPYKVSHMHQFIEPIVAWFLAVPERGTDTVEMNSAPDFEREYRVV